MSCKLARAAPSPESKPPAYCLIAFKTSRNHAHPPPGRPAARILASHDHDPPPPPANASGPLRPKTCKGLNPKTCKGPQPRTDLCLRPGSVGPYCTWLRQQTPAAAWIKHAYINCLSGGRLAEKKTPPPRPTICGASISLGLLGLLPAPGQHEPVCMCVHACMAQCLLHACMRQCVRIQLYPRPPSPARMSWG